MHRGSGPSAGISMVRGRELYNDVAAADPGWKDSVFDFQRKQGRFFFFPDFEPVKSKEGIRISRRARAVCPVRTLDMFSITLTPMVFLRLSQGPSCHRACPGTSGLRTSSGRR